MNFDADFWLFIGGLVSGLVSGYITRVLARGSEGIQLISVQSSFRLFIGVLSTVALIAAIVWGFMYLPWWWVVLSFVGVSLLIVPVIIGGRTRLLFMLGMQPLFDIAAVLLVGYLWFTTLKII
ncbi:MAG: hypothetical protein H8D23_06010 [Candidatus Brocadiales bacterium]|nr:hypothetical protein [Candidatus Brocadiales bacterium]